MAVLQASRLRQQLLSVKQNEMKTKKIEKINKIMISIEMNVSNGKSNQMQANPIE